MKGHSKDAQHGSTVRGRCKAANWKTSRSCHHQQQHAAKVCVSFATPSSLLHPPRYWPLLASAAAESVGDAQEVMEETRAELQWLASVKEAPRDRSGEVRQMLTDAKGWEEVCSIVMDLGRELGRQIGMAFDVTLLLADMVNSRSGVSTQPLSRTQKQLLAAGEQLPTPADLQPALSACVLAMATNPVWLAGPRVVPYLSALGSLRSAGYLTDWSRHTTFLEALGQVGSASVDKMRVEQQAEIVDVLVNKLGYMPKSSDWMPKIMEYMLGKLRHLNVQGLSGVLQACEKIGMKSFTPSPYWVREVLDVPTPLLLQMRPASLCALAAFVSTHAPPIKDAEGRRSLVMESWYNTFQSAWVAQLHAFTLPQVLSLLRSFHTMGAPLTHEQLNRACYHVLRRLQAGQDQGSRLKQEVCQLLLAVRQALPDDDDGADEASGGQWGGYGYQQDNLSYGYERGSSRSRFDQGRQQGGGGVADSAWLGPWLMEWAQECVAHVEETPVDAARFLVALSSIPGCSAVPAEVVAELLDMIEPGLDMMKATLLLALPAALEKLGYNPSPGWLASYFDGSRSALDRASPSQLRSLCQAVTCWGQPAPADWVAALGIAVKRQVSSSGRMPEEFAEGLLVAGYNPKTLISTYYTDLRTLPVSVGLKLVQAYVSDPDVCDLEQVHILLIMFEPALLQLPPQQLAALIVSLARAQACIDDFFLPQRWQQSYMEAVVRAGRTLQPTQATAIMWSLQNLGWAVDKEVLLALSQACKDA